MTTSVDGKSFSVKGSFIFAAQIPDDTLGCSGSRCSNCGGMALYGQQICRTCHLPFIGPFGFPQIHVWHTKNLGERTALVEKVFLEGAMVGNILKTYGRLGCTVIESIPIMPNELTALEELGARLNRSLFLHVHEFPASELPKILKTQD